MNKKLLLALACCMLQSIAIFAQKEIYIPTQMKSEGYSETDESQTWCKVRSRESDNIIVFWQSGYGDNDPNSSAVPSAYRVDVDDLLEKLESFYDVYVNQLKFAVVGEGKSNLDKYKMVICLYYTTDWMAYGSGFDDLIGGMWISPSTCQPVGSTIAHEMGHSFQYQCYCDLGGYAGFRYEIGTGCTYWEQTAQWQSYVIYPEEAFSSYNFSVYLSNHHRAFTHEWQRYASYFLHFYQAEKYGIDIIGKIWRGGTTNGYDANQVYMDVTGISTEEFYKECYEAAAKFATWDIDGIRDYGANYIGQHEYNYVDLGNGQFQVAYASCPQSTGYNLIPLQVPEGGGEIQTIFTAIPYGRSLADGDPGICNVQDDGSYETTTAYNRFSGFRNRGFRHGYVALLSNGEKVYQSVDTVYATGNLEVSDTTTFTVPENTERLWFVVSPAPTTYFVHEWDEDETDDDQWPYRVEFENTDILGHVDIGDPNEAIHDTIYHCYIGLEPSTDYSGTTVTIEGDLAEAIGKAFKMQPSEIENYMTSWSSTQSDGTITFWALNPTTYEPVSSASTANGYGHWFNASSNVTNWGSSSVVYSEYTSSTRTFLIGPYPGAVSDGDVYTIGQAFKYQKDGETALAKIIFHIYVGGVPSDNPAVKLDTNNNGTVNVYNIGGSLVKSAVEESIAKEGLDKGLYIIGEKKVLVE